MPIITILSNDKAHHITHPTTEVSIALDMSQYDLCDMSPTCRLYHDLWKQQRRELRKDTVTDVSFCVHGKYQSIHNNTVHLSV
jgi:hypothetical protein